MLGRVQALESHEVSSLAADDMADDSRASIMAGIGLCARQFIPICFIICDWGSCYGHATAVALVSGRHVRGRQLELRVTYRYR
jgi:hypothetical protein